VRAELRALTGVETPLEKGAEDGGLNLRPVELGDAAHDLDVSRLEGDDIRAVEEAAVEPLDPVGAEAPALLGHRAEQFAQGTGEASRSDRVPSMIRRSSVGGRRPASSANMQKSSLFFGAGRKSLSVRPVTE
jgi:hypothetical protein